MRAEQVKGLMEAYSHVYEAPEVLNEEVVEEGIEVLDEAPMTAFQAAGGQAKLDQLNKNRSPRAGRATAASIEKLGQDNLFKAGGGNAAIAKGPTRSQNVRGGGTRQVPTLTRQDIINRGTTATAKPAAKPTAVTPAVKPADKPVATPATKPTATAAPKPTTPAAPAKPAGSAMDQWAKANPKLAAAKAERDRTRGTSATTNPLMKDMKSSLPAPKSPSPSTASTAFGLAKKGVNLAAGVDIFDLVKGHLLDEGYADSEEGAMVIMINMSEEWRKSILESHGVEILDEISKELALKAHAERGTREFESDSDNPKDFTKSGKSKADESERRIVKKHGEGARREANRAAEKRIYGHNKYSEAQEREQAKKKVTKEDLEAWVDELIAEGYDLSEYTWEEVAEIYAQELELSEAQRARENPEDHDKEEKRKYEPVRGERTPMPPRGDKRREEFEKWYAKQMGR